MLRKYGTATHVYIPIVKAASANFAVGADWTPAAGDVKISKDGGAAANVTNLPTAIGMGNGAMWDFSLTATEMQAASVVVIVADSATKAVEDQAIVIETYGNASAEHAFDLDTATQAVTVAAGGLTAASVATDAIDADALADGAITAATFAAGAIDAAAIAADAIGSSELAASAVTEIQSGLATASAVADVQTDTNDIQSRLPAALVSGRMDSSVGAMAANTLTASALAADAVSEVQSGLASQASVDTIDDFLDTEVAAIKAKTDNLPASPAATGDIPTAATVADAVWDEATTGHTTAGTFGEQVKTDIDAILVDTAEIGAAGAGLTALASQASVNTIDDLLDTEVAAIKSDTAAILADTGTDGVVVASINANAVNASALNADAVTEIQSGLATAAALNTVDDFLDTEIASIISSLATIAGYIDSEVGAIKAKTDLLPAAPAATGDIPTAAQVRDAILAGTIDELAAVPAASPTLEQALAWLYMAVRNKVTTSTTQTKIHNDAGTAIGTAAVSDSGSVFERGEYA